MRWILLIVVCFLLFLAIACREKKPTKTPTPKTRMTAPQLQRLRPALHLS